MPAVKRPAEVERLAVAAPLPLSISDCGAAHADEEKPQVDHLEPRHVHAPQIQRYFGIVVGGDVEAGQVAGEQRQHEPARCGPNLVSHTRPRPGPQDNGIWSRIARLRNTGLVHKGSLRHDSMNPTSSSGLSGAWLIFLFIAPFLGVGIVLAILWPTGEPELRYITGCEGSKLVAPVVNLFAEPSTPPVVAQLAGSGGIRCRGSVVIVQERRWRDRRLFARVVNVAGGETGWVLDRFIGPDFDTARCLGVFGTTSTDAVRRCEGR